MKTKFKAFVSGLVKLVVPVVVSVVLIAGVLWTNGYNLIDLMTGKSSGRRARIPNEVLSGEVLASYEEDDKGRRVTIVEIESAMRQIGEVTTVSYSYSGIESASDCADLFGHNFEVTRNRLEVDYSGTIRAGYSIGDIRCDVDNDNQVIIVTLPKPEVFSNDIIPGDVRWDDNVFNRVEADVASQLINEARAKQLDKAIDNGLFRDANASAQDIIRDVLSDLCDYDVVFEGGQASDAFV